MHFIDLSFSSLSFHFSFALIASPPIFPSCLLYFFFLLFFSMFSSQFFLGSLSLCIFFLLFIFIVIFHVFCLSSFLSSIISFFFVLFSYHLFYFGRFSLSFGCSLIHAFTSLLSFVLFLRIFFSPFFYRSCLALGSRLYVILFVCLSVFLFFSVLSLSQSVCLCMRFCFQGSSLYFSNLLNLSFDLHTYTYTLINQNICLTLYLSRYTYI